VGVELELGVLLALVVVGEAVFGPFETETPAWKKVLKWTVVVALTTVPYRALGHLVLAVPLVLGALGVAVHFSWCAKHGIHPLKATPRKRYYELRGWDWPD